MYTYIYKISYNLKIQTLLSQKGHYIIRKGTIFEHNVIGYLYAPKKQRLETHGNNCYNYKTENYTGRF